MVQPSIQEYYKGKNVFTTGATGFLGKVLVEKLLWSCPDIGTVFINVRSKQDCSVQERVDEIIKSPVFDRIREKKPSQLKKLVAMEGDITEDNLGLSQQDLEVFFNEVNVVFHSAASIRFNDPIQEAIKNNSLPTKRLIEMAHKMKRLEALIYVSTAFSNWYRHETPEVPYLPPYDSNVIFELTQSLPDEMVEQLEPILLKSPGGRHFLNTYMYSKYLAEAIVTLEGEGLPRAIVRPSVVIATLTEPMPGWIDNWGGPTERIVNLSRGLIKYSHGNPSHPLDIIPADMVVNCTIAAAYKTAIEPTKSVQVYNSSTGSANKITIREFFEHVVVSAQKYPYDRVMSVPSMTFSVNYFARTFSPFLFHYTPAFFIDLSRRLQGKKPFMNKLHHTLEGFYGVIKFATLVNPGFINENGQKLALSLSPSDQKEFPFDVRTINWKQCTDSYVLGVKKYLLKEDCSKEAIDKGLKRISRLKLINRGAKLAFFGASLVVAGSLINCHINSKDTDSEAN